MSDELIFHYYTTSPFAEKVRLAMCLKKLSWRSVIIDMVPPRPQLEPLTGGYRRVPVLQVGADIYCDTHLILRTLDRLRPDPPTLFSDSITQPLCWWWDKATFIPIVKLWAGLHGDKLTPAFLDDRKKMFLGDSLSKEDNKGDISLNAQRIRAHLVWLTDILADGRLFLLDRAVPSALDITAYHTIWFAKLQMGNEGEALLPLLYHPGLLLSWFERVTALGHGAGQEMTPEQAFDVAKQSEPIEPSYIRSDENNEWRVGQRVRVTPDDYGRVPVEGTFVAADNHEIVIQLSNEKAGTINVHFPRAGFDVIPDFENNGVR